MDPELETKFFLIIIKQIDRLIVIPQVSSEDAKDAVLFHMTLHRQPFFPFIQTRPRLQKSISSITGILTSREHLKASKTEATEDPLFHYISPGKLDQALLLFAEIEHPNILQWNSMIRACAWDGRLHRAVNLFRAMLHSGTRPNNFSFPFALKACSGLHALNLGLEMHAHVVKTDLRSDLFISTAFLDLYMKCGQLLIARHMFNEMPTTDVVAWNAMIAGYSLHGMHEEAVDLVVEMQNEGFSPNSSTVVALLPSIGEVKDLIQVKSVHGFCVRRCLDSYNVHVSTALLDVYAKCLSINYSEKIFASLFSRNEVTWSAMIGAYVSCNLMLQAFEAFRGMVNDQSSKPTSVTIAGVLRACAGLTDVCRGKQLHCYATKLGISSDTTVGNSLLSMYSKCGKVNSAVDLFREIETKDVVSYSAIISGCLQNGEAEMSLTIFRQMRTSSVDPDAATMVGVIPACSHLSALQHGRCSHSYVLIRGLSRDTSISNALLDMYAKCGSVGTARKLFDGMTKRDIVTWNTMMSGYGLHGLGREALSLFSRLQLEGLNPDDVTFIGLLSACSHSGLIEEGKKLFSAMMGTFEIALRVEHCICMVDLLGRGGHLGEALDFVRTISFSDVRIWGALLGACRIHKDLTLGEKVSKIIQEMGPEGTGNFVLMSNIYSSAGRFEEAASVRIWQKIRGFRKSPGCSWIEIKGKVHAFMGGDRSHPYSKSIYETLADLFIEIKKLGYKADTSFVLQNVEEEEKEHLLLYHSEKLAVAFGIISLNPNQPIFVTKNLRICGDCHSAIKFISKIAGREITIRDANRFHHFSEGSCSCGNFW